MAPSSNIKKLLSEAQKCIQNKEFPSAISKCKEVLKEDKTNSWAFILLGAAYKDTDKREAVKYLRLARESTEHSAKALQGLFHCAENDELLDVCKQLLQLTPSTKFIEIHNKLVCIGEINPWPCVDILSNDLTIDNNVERLTSAYCSICKIFAGKCKDFDEKYKELYEKSIEFITKNLSAEELLGIENAANLLEIAHKQKCYIGLIKLACRLADVSRRQTIPLEWICKIHCENVMNTNDNELKKLLQDVISEYVERLLELTPNSTLGLMSKGLCLIAQTNYIEAKNILLKVNNQQPNWNICLKQLVEIYQIFGAWSMVEYFLDKLKVIDVELVQCLSEQNVKEKTLKAIQLCKQLLPTAIENPQKQVKLITMLAKSLINNGQIEAAQKTIEKLSEFNETDIANYLLSLLHNQLGDHRKSLEILIDNPPKNESCQHYLQLSGQYFALKQYDSALECCTRSIRLEPFNANAFYWLGKIFMTLDNHSKATKCLEKCTSLHPQHEQGVYLLSAIYRQTSNWTANSMLLTNAVTALPGSQCNWASNQLGFHYLAQNDFNGAINSFRVALRANVDSQSSWEGLADAYMQRGSLNSALKVYQKIVELNPTNLYPKLQVANVKTMLRLHKEAVVAYEELLIDEPKYFPALKGIAEAHLGLMVYYLPQRLLGRSRQHAVDAVRYLIEAIQIKGNVACLWRMLANAFETVASLPDEYAKINVPGSLANLTVDTVTLAGDQLYEMASKFYCRALKIRNYTDDLLWYELSLNYYLRAIRQINNPMKADHLRLAAESIKHTIKLAPSRWKNWNLLGCICATKEINNLPLAQHSFIKAITIDKKCTISWTNLGVLYMIKGDIKLANQAFGRAQQSDTGYINAWTGQACIAETIGQQDEAMDLFKHCTTLGYTPESAIGFTHWVCTVMNDEKLRKDTRFSYALETLHGTSVALDSITWFCNGDAKSLEALCFMGYLCYQQRLYKPAAIVFEKAAALADGAIKDNILCNLGYSHLKANQPELAVEIFQSVTEATFQSTIGLAYAQFKAKQYESSYSVYESALEWLATDDTQKAMILIAMSAMVYSFQGDNYAKTLLFQCIALPKPPIEGLFSGCALGILHDDMQLSELVLNELKRFENNCKYSHHIVFLMSQFYLKTDGTHKALIYILEKLHHQPNNALIRKVLANFLLRNYPKNKKYLIGASRIAESSICLQMKNLNSENSSLECSKTMAMASEAMRFVDQKIRKKLAQRAVFLNPTCKEAWASLILCDA